MKLSANFQLSELVKSQVADRKGIPNNPSPSSYRQFKKLVFKCITAYKVTL
jgi:hypothetical protein